MDQIWMYWQTPTERTKPPYLDLCLQTIERHRGILTLHVLNEKSIREYLPDLRPETAHLSLVHRADYYRSRLVHRYGGIWLDADVIALRPLTELVDELGNHDVALYGRGVANLSVGCFLGVAGSPLLADWMVRQDSAIDSQQDIPWNGLGKALLVEAAGRHGFHPLPVERIAPLPWNEWKKLLSRWRAPDRHLAAAPILFMLYNKFLHDAFGDMTASEILEADMLISKLFRIALGSDG